MSDYCKIIRAWFDALAISLINEPKKWSGILDKDNSTGMYPLLHYNCVHGDDKWSSPPKFLGLDHFIDTVLRECNDLVININILSSIFKDMDPHLINCNLILNADYEPDGAGGIVRYLFVYLQPISRVQASL